MKSNVPKASRMQNIRKMIIPLFSIVLMLFISLTFSPIIKAQTPRLSCENAANKVDLDGYEMISTLTIIDSKNRKRERKIISASAKFGETSKRLMKFTDPPEVRGTAMLVYDHKNKTDDIWIFLPALRKVRRIVSKEKNKSFMGSEFNHADMSQPNPDDFTYLLLGQEQIKGKDHQVIQVNCKSPDIALENGYTVKKVYIDLQSSLTTQVIYFDKQNKPERKQIFLGYKPLKSGKFYAELIQIENLRNHRKSELFIGKIQDIKELNEAYFIPSNLEEL